jgi:hypothetical protein
MTMAYLTFHTKEYPQFERIGARFVVIAIYGAWRDGEITNNPREIPLMQRELRKRFMTRYDHAA